MTVTVDTSTLTGFHDQPLATGFGNQRKMAKVGDRVVAVSAVATPTTGTDGGARFLWSQDRVTWTEYANIITGWHNGSICHVLIGSTDYLVAAWRNWSTNGGLKHNTVYVAVGTFNAGLTTLTWGTPVELDATATASGEELAVDLDVVNEGTGALGVVVWHHLDRAGTQVIRFSRISLSSGGVLTNTTRQDIGNPFTAVYAAHPSVAIDPVTKHAGIGFSTNPNSGGGIKFVKLTYLGSGSYTVGAYRAISTDTVTVGENGVGPQYEVSTLTCRWDSKYNEWVLMGPRLYDGTNYLQAIWTRNLADTSNQQLHYELDTVDPGHLSEGTGVVDPVTGDIFLIGARHDSLTGAARPVEYRHFQRVAAWLVSVGSTVSVDADQYAHHVTALYDNPLVHLLWTSGASSPWNVRHSVFQINRTPDAATPTRPVSGEVIERDAVQRFSWTFTDVNPGDLPSGYQIRYRAATETAWTTQTAVTGSASTFHDFASGTFSIGEWEWQVRVRDAQGSQSAYSASAFFEVDTAPSGLAWITPVDGGTVSTQSLLVQWSTSDQELYRVRVLADLDGEPDEDSVVYDSGWITSTSRQHLVPFPETGVTRHVQVAVQANGLISSWVSAQVSVSFTLPAPSQVFISEDDPYAGAIGLSAVHPTPTGSEPTVVALHWWRRELGDLTDGLRVNPSAVNPTAEFVDWAVASGVAYEYRLQAVGDTGAYRYSAWLTETFEFDDTYEDTYEEEFE